MTDGLINSAAQLDEPSDRRLYGIVLAQVVDNVDQTNRGRVQLQIKGLPGIEPWVRVAVLAAGNNRGTYFIPQKGDEVLAVFNQGMLTDGYVIGCLWNGPDRPPSSSANDARNKQIIRTGAGHEIVLDDQQKSITITSASRHVITLTQSKVQITTKSDTASLTLDGAGTITIKAKERLVLDAPSISIQGKLVEIGGSSSVRVDGGSNCSIQAGQVRIN